VRRCVKLIRRCVNFVHRRINFVRLSVNLVRRFAKLVRLSVNLMRRFVNFVHWLVKLVRRFFKLVQVSVVFGFRSLSTASSSVAYNGEAAWRGRGYTNVRAGDTLPNLHKCFCGHTPPLSPNRSLAAVHFVITAFYSNQFL
jgi:hypothetical protein